MTLYYSTKRRSKVNIKRQSKVKSTRRSKVKSTRRSKVKSRRSKVNSKRRSKVNSKQRSKVNIKRRSKVNSKRRSKVNSKRRSKVNSKRRSKVNSKRRSKVNSKSQSKVDSKRQSKAIFKRLSNLKLSIPFEGLSQKYLHTLSKPKDKIANIYASDFKEGSELKYGHDTFINKKNKNNVLKFYQLKIMSKLGKLKIKDAKEFYYMYKDRLFKKVFKMTGPFFYEMKNNILPNKTVVFLY
jgi:hypothetical protein